MIFFKKVINRDIYDILNCKKYYEILKGIIKVIPILMFIPYKNLHFNDIKIKQKKIIMQTLKTKL